MATQRMVWFSDAGEACSSEGDARLADASDAITKHVTDNCGVIECKDDMIDALREDHLRFSTLLTNYRIAVERRTQEVQWQMIACTEVLDEDQLLHDLPGALFDEEDCPACDGSGYSGYGDPCVDCMMRGSFLTEAKGDDE